MTSVRNQLQNWPPWMGRGIAFNHSGVAAPSRRVPLLRVGPSCLSWMVPKCRRSTLHECRGDGICLWHPMVVSNLLYLFLWLPWLLVTSSSHDWKRATVLFSRLKSICQEPFSHFWIFFLCHYRRGSSNESFLYGKGIGFPSIPAAIRSEYLWFVLHGVPAPLLGGINSPRGWQKLQTGCWLSSVLSDGLTRRPSGGAAWLQAIVPRQASKTQGLKVLAGDFWGRVTLQGSKNHMFFARGTKHVKAVPTLFPINSWLAWLLLPRFVTLGQRTEATGKGLLLLVGHWASMSALAKRGLDHSDSGIRWVPGLCGVIILWVTSFISSLFGTYSGRGTGGPWELIHSSIWGRCLLKTKWPPEEKPPLLSSRRTLPRWVALSSACHMWGIWNSEPC